MTRTAQGVALLAIALVACSRTTDVYLGADEALQAPTANGGMRPALDPPLMDPPAQPSPAGSGGVVDDASLPKPPPTPELGPALPSDAGEGLDAEARTIDAGPPPSLVCATGTADCDGDASNGCETNTDRDLQNCGGCARLCHAMGHDALTATCVAGRCELACREDGIGDQDCDGDPDNGCETKTFTDTQNCGGCGIVCNFCYNAFCL